MREESSGPGRGRKRLPWLGLAVILAASVRAASAQDALVSAQSAFVVGLDSRYCTHGSIQDALGAAEANGPGTDVIIVTGEINYTNQSLDIAEQSVELWAGYSCEYPNYDSPVTLRGNGSSPVVRVQSSSTFRDKVVLRNLVLTGGGGPRGGGLSVEGAAWVVLDAVDVTGNAAGQGGGIALAQLGGSGVGGGLELLANTRVTANSAQAASGGSGGGIFVGKNSQVYIVPDGVLVAQNSARDAGGGIAVSGGSVTVGSVGAAIQRDDARGVAVSGNTAMRGGGISVIGADSFLVAREMAIENNHSAMPGGGILAQSGAYFSLSRDYSVGFRVNCPEEVHCSRLSGNTSAVTSEGVKGAAVALYQGARGYINQTEIVNHSAELGGVVWVDGSTLQLEGVLFTGNTTRYGSTSVGAMIKLRYLAPEPPPVVTIAFSTFAGNAILGHPLGSIGAQDVQVQQNGRMHIHSSAFFDSAYPEVFYSAASNATVDCAVSRQGGTFDVPVTRSTRSNTPGFVSANDYRLTPTSPLLDYCDTSAYAPAYRDLDRRPRCYDRTATSNTYGACDVGAFELAPPLDLIFADGFESGDTSAWATAAGNLGVNWGSALAGTRHGLEAGIGFGSSHHVRDDTPSDERRYRARFYFDPNGADPGNTMGHHRVRLLIASDAASHRLVTLVLRRIGTYSLRARVRLDDGTRADTPFFAIDDGPHFVEIDWIRSSSPTANDGQFVLQIDGVVVSTLSGLGNGASGVDSVRVGALSVKSGAAGWIWFDEFSSRRRLGIGP